MKVKFIYKDTSTILEVPDYIKSIWKINEKFCRIDESLETKKIGVDIEEDEVFFFNMSYEWLQEYFLKVYCTLMDIKEDKRNLNILFLRDKKYTICCEVEYIVVD
jgi:hypothetical protein